MGAVVYISLLFAPVMAFAIYFYLKNRYDANFSVLLTRSYLAGILSTLIYLAVFLIAKWSGLANPVTLKRMLFFSFFVAGFGSEFSKFIFFRYYVIPHPVIDKPIHAITFSVMTALGFSTITQIYFLCDFFELQSYYPSVMYAFVNVPSNLIFSIIMGFFIGLSRFVNAKMIYSVIGLFGAAFFHGIFKFCLLAKDYKLLSLFAFGSAIIVLVLIIKALFTNTESLA
jgi:protease PrsW